MNVGWDMNALDVLILNVVPSWTVHPVISLEAMGTRLCLSKDALLIKNPCSTAAAITSQT